MSLRETAHTDLKTAMKARDSVQVATLRLLMAELDKAALDKPEGVGLDEAEEAAVVQRAIKQRRESIEAFDKAGRPDAADKERAEEQILAAYLPQQLSDDELTAAVKELIAETGAASPRDMGRLMGPLMKKFPGRLDGTRARQAVQAALAAG